TQQSATPSDRVQNTGDSSARSLGRQYHSPRSKFTTEQSRLLPADTAISNAVRWKTGMATPQPPRQRGTARTSEIRLRRMRRGLPGKDESTVDRARILMGPC